MLTLSKWDRSLEPIEVARKSYWTDGVKHAGWQGYIEVKPDSTGKLWTSYFRSTPTKSHYPCFSTEILG